MKKKVEYGDLKGGDCFRLTKKGPIWQEASKNDGCQCLTGKQAGRVKYYADAEKKVIPVKVKIAEVK